MTFIPGTKVVARGIAWEVVHSDRAGEQTRVRLRCLLPDIRGFELDLLHPFERIDLVLEDFQPEKAGRLQSWRLYHSAFLLDQALGPAALLASQPGRLEIEPYQLVPLMRVLRMPRPRLLLADGVGLGKTIQAGLILSELISRRRAHRILIISPAGPLLKQWDQEMKERFGIRFRSIQSWTELQDERKRLELGANPFDQMDFCLMSIDFAKQEKVLQDLERTTWDLAIIDEAHHCVSMEGGGDREDSRRRRLAEVVAKQSDGLLLLTATPHDGYDPHFASLMELLDPSLVDGRGELRETGYRQFVVRRLKKHILDRTGKALFQERDVYPRNVPMGNTSDSAYAKAQYILMELISPRLRAAMRQKRFDEVLAFIALLKRSVSTAAACRKTLQVVQARYALLSSTGGEDQEIRKERLRSLKEYRKRLERYGALSQEEEEDRNSLEAEEIASELLRLGEEETDIQGHLRQSRAGLERVRKTESELMAVLGAMDKACEEDPKLKALADQVAEIRGAEPGANVIIYTEYIDSQEAALEYLQRHLPQRGIQGLILAISGKDNEKDRTLVTSRFTSEENLILISTDALAEGLNLHAHCHHLIHLELPYNPNRLEQRNGRIDRYGQSYRPQIRYLYLAGTFEERLLLRLLAKFERQRERLTFMPNTLGLSLENPLSTTRLLEGVLESQGSLFSEEAPAIRSLEEVPEASETPSYRELLAEVDKALSGFERAAKTHEWFVEKGLAAEEQLSLWAKKAQEDGKTLNPVALEDFVYDSVVAEGGAIQKKGGWVEISLPSSLVGHLEGCPGFDQDRNVLRVTLDKSRLHTDSGERVGFLGRAHPLVARALDRMRHLKYAGGADWEDRRVSAAKAPDGKLGALLTFLLAWQSPEGREFERVVGVHVHPDGTAVIVQDPGEWMAWTQSPVATGEVWKKLIEVWLDGLRDKATDLAMHHFQSLSKVFQAEWFSDLARERQRLEEWIRFRAKAICGEAQEEQVSLFDLNRPSNLGESKERWKTLEKPDERLLALTQDSDVSRSKRLEAEIALQHFHRRRKELDARMELKPSPATPLGLLMLVP